MWYALRGSHPRLALLLWIFPLGMAAVVLTTGNHYVLDIAGSVTLLAISIVPCRGGSVRGRRRDGTDVALPHLNTPELQLPYRRVRPGSAIPPSPRSEQTVDHFASRTTPGTSSATPTVSPSTHRTRRPPTERLRQQRPAHCIWCPTVSETRDTYVIRRVRPGRMPDDAKDVRQHNSDHGFDSQT